MRFLSFLKICGIIFLAGCASSINEVVSESSNGIQQSPDFPGWIDTVVLNSQPRATEYEFNYQIGHDLKSIDSTFFKNHLVGFEIDSSLKWNVVFYPFVRYYFFDYKKFDSWISFTIKINTEFGYDYYFMYTFDLKSNKITTVSCVSETGADGGAYNNEYLFFDKTGTKLTVRTQSYYDQDIDYTAGRNHCYTRTFDSIVSNFHFFPNKTEFSMDTVVSRIDTLCFD